MPVVHPNRSGWLLANRAIPSATAFGPPQSYAVRSFSISILSCADRDDKSRLLIGSVTITSRTGSGIDILCRAYKSLT